MLFSRVLGLWRNTVVVALFLYVVFKGSWVMEKHRRSSPFLFGSFSFVDGGGIVDNFADFAFHVAP
jgi:hypothetical protein